MRLSIAVSMGSVGRLLRKEESPGVRDGVVAGAMTAEVLWYLCTAVLEGRCLRMQFQKL